MLSLFQTILSIRVKQFWRMLGSVGWWLVLLFIIAFGGIFLAMLEQLLQAPEPGWSLLIGWGLLAIHFNRGDFYFLKKLSISPRLFFAIEYLCGLVPLLLFMMIMSRWIDLIGSILMVGLVSLLPMQLGLRKWSGQARLRWIPLKAFEWRSGIRQRPLPLFLLYLTGLIASWFFPFTYIIMLLLFALIVSGFFEIVESKDLLEALYLPHRTLLPKVLLSWSVFHILLLPFHLVFLFRFLSYWYVGIAAIGMSSLLLAFSLYYKYAGYYPKRLRVYNQTPVGIFFLSMLVPFFWPGVIIYGLIKWRQAEQTLKHYYA